VSERTERSEGHERRRWSGTLRSRATGPCLYHGRMALLHQAELRPTKLELLAAWLPGRRWYAGAAGAALTRVAACRFDDPAGAVGVETMLVRPDGGPVHHVPLTYRDAPRSGGDEWLLGVAEHSVLGRRWVYDACGDPVYAAALAAAIAAGTGEAEEFVEEGGELRRREPAMRVRGSGTPEGGLAAVTAVLGVVDRDPTLIATNSVELAVLRVVDPGARVASPALTGVWPGQPEPVPLAYLRPAQP